MARREYALTTTDMPEEASIKALDVGAQWLYDRLRFRKEISRCGVLQWRPALYAELGPDATDRKIRSWAKQLEARGQIVLDEPYAECLVRTYVRWDGILGQPNVIPHVVYDFGLIASAKVRLGFLREFRRLWDLDALTDGERGGWLAATGHFPRKKYAADDPAKWPVALEAGTLARLVREIGTGIREPLASAIEAGDVAPFDETSRHGIPDPFRAPLPGTPSPDPSEDGSSRTHVSAGARTVLQQPITENRSPVTETENRVRVTAPPAADAADTHTQAEQLIDEHVGRLAGAVRLALVQHTQQLLEEGHDANDVATGLTDWRRRPGSGAGLLPWLVSERLLQRENGRRSGGGQRKAWCGACDESTRTEPVDPDDDASAYRRCPRCHPAVAVPA